LFVISALRENIDELEEKIKGQLNKVVPSTYYSVLIVLKHAFITAIYIPFVMLVLWLLD